jgi:protein SCO1/2
MSGSQKTLLIALAVVAAVLIGLSLSTLLPPSEEGASSQAQNRALIGGPFELTDHNGNRVTEKDYAGQYKLIYFGFTYCPDVCPTELQTMSAALEEMGENAEKVQPLLITIDPERDTPEALAQYVGHFHSRLVGLTGTPEEVAAAAKAYRVYYAKVEDEGSSAEYTMDHSSVLYFMGPDGGFLTHFGPGTAPSAMAERMNKLIEEEGGQAS